MKYCQNKVHNYNFELLKTVSESEFEFVFPPKTPTEDFNPQCKVPDVSKAPLHV